MARCISDRMVESTYCAALTESTPSEDTWLARMREGDPLAFEALYELHQPRVLAMALHRGCPEPEAEDVVHEVFMALWRRPPPLGATTKLSTWLYRVTANKVASLHRRRAVRRALTGWWTPPAEVLPPDLAAREEVRAVLEHMAPKKREVLVLFELEERSGEEIAELLGCRINTVWTRLHHARAEFRKISARLDGGAS